MDEIRANDISIFDFASRSDDDDDIIAENNEFRVIIFLFFLEGIITIT